METVIAQNLQHILHQIPANVQLIAVSKTKPNDDILAAYNSGHRHFGENYVQELVNKESLLPKDICWHFIGHLQSNKVKYIAPFVHLIHGVDSLNLLKEINKQAAKNNRIIDCLIQVHIAMEETKFGFDIEETKQLFETKQTEQFNNVRIRGLMGMASFSNDLDLVRDEFKQLASLYRNLKLNHHDFDILSMGMSNDFKIAIEEGSNMIRVGSLIFGERNYQK